MSDTELLAGIRDQLDRWAKESRRGGWSTHQVDPMTRLANQINLHLKDRPGAVQAIVGNVAIGVGNAKVHLALSPEFDEEGDGPWLTVTPSDWPASWPPRVGDEVLVTKPEVVAVTSREAVIVPKGGR